MSVLILFNDFFLLQLLTIMTIVFYSLSINILTSWLLAGVYLLLVGDFLLLDDIDIFVGFLWVLDLGVGLVFFVFILYFSDFLFFKVKVDVNSRFLFTLIFILFYLILFYFIFSSGVDFNIFLNKVWFFFITYYDYYLLYNVYGLIDLNVLRELYFFFNSFEFFIINFVVFYGIISSILTLFMLNKLLIMSNLFNYTTPHRLSNITYAFFIRSQNFFKQKTTSAGSRVWFKHKKL